MATPPAKVDEAKQARIKRIAEDLRRLRQIRGTSDVAPKAGKTSTQAKGAAAIAPHLHKSKVMDYRVLRMIGEGAMSRVYLAKRVADNSTIVLKIMDTRRGRNDVLIKRFIREAELISSLRSRYVVRIFDNGFTDNYGYIAMEHFPRGDLRTRVKMGIEPSHALCYLNHLALGLAAIHSVGVVHRDLKPANLMFRADDTLALADFGISKRLDEKEEDEDEQLTMVGQVLGTPYYMSPEQGQGLPVDQRADLYSVGVIFYEIMTGERPFRARTPSGIIYQHIHADIPKLPGPLNRFQYLLNHLLAKEPDSRYSSALELVEALDEAIRMPTKKRF